LAIKLAAANWLAYPKSSRLYEFISYKFYAEEEYPEEAVFVSELCDSCDLLYTFLRKDTLVPFVCLMVSWCCDS